MPAMSAADPTAERLLFVAPSRWDEACFAVPAVRALMGKGLAITVLCRVEQEAFWQSLGALELYSYAAKAPCRDIALQLSPFKLALMFEAGVAADACVKAKIARRIGPQGEGIDRLLTDAIALAP